VKIVGAKFVRDVALGFYVLHLVSDAPLAQVEVRMERPFYDMVLWNGPLAEPPHPANHINSDSSDRAASARSALQCSRRAVGDDFVSGKVGQARMRFDCFIAKT
jgi:hypothetical protein